MARRRVVRFLQEFSVPLIAGVFVALAAANLDVESYESILAFEPIPGLVAFGHAVTFKFLIDDVFMVFFFGVAAKEITESVLPGGSLNPFRKAINPLLGTIGGIVGPVATFFVLLALFKGGGAFTGIPDDVVRRGWGIPTATDIALAWLVARTVFGGAHPAVSFLLLLAVADDAIGLAIIAIFYGDPTHPADPMWLGLCLAGMAAAWLMRRKEVRSWIPYIAIGGPLSWCGLLMANLHPALALVFIVPFLPGPKRDTGLFVDQDEVDEAEARGVPHGEHSPLHNFEHDLKLFVDVGLFFFAFANAGVPLAGIGPMTWIILGSLAVGKTIGIGGLSWIGMKLGFPLPTGMGVKDLLLAGFVAALGLTVALFVAGAAFGKTSPELLGQAKMGALFSGFVGIAAILIGRMIRIRKID